jgi:hypothetical protein
VASGSPSSSSGVQIVGGSYPRERRAFSRRRRTTAQPSASSSRSRGIRPIRCGRRKVERVTKCSGWKSPGPDDVFRQLLRFIRDGYRRQVSNQIETCTGHFAIAGGRLVE